MIFFISLTDIGSTPANGSSSKINCGLAANARAISTRRRSPPDKLIPVLLRIWLILNSSSSASASCSCSAELNPLRVCKIAMMFSNTVNFLKIEASCGKYPIPRRARSCMGSWVNSLSSMLILPLSRGTRPTIM
mmetsp:Transcript_6751/g.17389  ORF Transcript_6751/g.17389 Transcript_6751/m.17389 type:complete len:134 (-) Transcript_6751:690-1091(-)